MKATIKDVAREAGVSVSTVSYALNRKGPAIKETHKRVLAAVEKLGYVPDATARSLVNSRTNNFAVIIGSIPGIEQDPYDLELISAFSKGLAQAGCWMSLYMDDGRHPDQAEALLRDAKIDGLVTIRTGGLPEASLKLIRQRQIPFIAYEDQALEDHCTISISVDPEPGIREAVEHLWSLGHRKILGFSFLETSERFQIIKKQLQPYGIEPGLVHSTGISLESAYRDMITFLDGNKALPTAIMTPTDLTAIGAVRALTERGYRVPEDVSVIGFDDIHEARQMLPPLTTISQNITSTAAMICRRLIELRDGEDSPERKITVGTSLVVRESTGPARE